MYCKLLPRTKFIICSIITFHRLTIGVLFVRYFCVHLTGAVSVNVCVRCVYVCVPVCVLTMLYAMTLIQMTIYMIDNVKVIKAHIHVALDVSVSLRGGVGF